MKESIRILAATFIASCALASCSCDNEEIRIPEPVIIEKEITIDTQDDLIRIDGYWLHNSNNDQNNWQNLQEIGFKIEDGAIWVFVDPDFYEIIDMELVNFPFYYDISYYNNFSWYFEGEGINQYIPNYSEIVHFKIKLKKLN